MCTVFPTPDLAPRPLIIVGIGGVAGILVYAIEDLSSAAFGRGGQQQQQQQDPASPVPVQADVALAGRPSRMVASRDNLRVAVAVGDKVGGS